MIFIYVLKCPSSGSPRYVGKTINPRGRLAAHVWNAKTGATSHHCARWIRQLLADGKRPTLEVIFRVPDVDDWQAHEKRLIAQYKADGYELTNLTGGGDGFFDPSPETLAKRGQMRKADWQDADKRARYIAALRGANKRPEVREAKSRGVKAAWADQAIRQSIIRSMNRPEALAIRSAATKKRNADPEFAKAHQERMKKLFRQPGRREQLRQASLKRWEGQAQRIAELRAARASVRQEHRARFHVEQAERLRLRWQDESHREKMQAARWTDETKARQAVAILDPDRQAKIKQALTPEVIARRNAAIKDSWARRKARKQEAQTP